MLTPDLLVYFLKKKIVCGGFLLTVCIPVGTVRAQDELILVFRFLFFSCTQTS